MIQLLAYLVVGVLPLVSTINCVVDESLANLTEYSYSLEVSPNDLTYWRSRSLNFQIYGNFDGDDHDATITGKACRIEEIL